LDRRGCPGFRWSSVVGFDEAAAIGLSVSFEAARLEGSSEAEASEEEEASSEEEVDDSSSESSSHATSSSSAGVDAASH
jgi:hypothetical protein